MTKITTDISTLPGDYRVFAARKKSTRPLSPLQQRIVGSMEPGVWYELDKERWQTCRALAENGWCRVARFHKKKSDGTLYIPEPEELLLDAIYARDTAMPIHLELFQRI